VRRDAPAITSLARRLRVLVVDDNRDVSATLTDLVRMIGHEVHIANDGPSAIVAAEQMRPDVVLLDIAMPGMTGHEVARRLRERFGGRGLQLVAVTGWGQPHDLARSRESGFDHHLVKPAGLASLRALLGDPRA
jgi:CheY-like chemotaxis protein